MAGYSETQLVGYDDEGGPIYEDVWVDQPEDTFNPARDSQQANEDIDQQYGPGTALAGYQEDDWSNPTDQRLAAGTQTTPGASSENSSGYSGILKQLGLLKPDGSVDWKTVLGLGGVGLGLAGGLTAKPRATKSVSDLMAGMPNNMLSAFTQDQMSRFSTPLKAGNQMARVSTFPSPIVKGVRGYAQGGEVEGALTQSAPFVGYVQGDGGGQDDLINASLSAGEYVFDAETVSMLGDGNNDEGARKLDELRASLRAQKRSAPDDEIAPPANGPLSYITGGTE